MDRDVNSEDQSEDYEEIKAENGTYFRCLICLRRLSRMQRIESHLSSIHGKVGCRKRKYKKYVDDPSIPIPKSTKFDRINRLKNTNSSSPYPIFLDSHVFGCDFQQVVQSEPDLATSDEITESLTEEMETTADAYAEEIVVCEDKVESYRQSESESDGNTSDDDANSSTSESSVEYDDSDTDDQESLDSPYEIQCDTFPEKTYSALDKASMAILSLISRHCITNEAAKDIIDLVKVLCPDNETLQTLSYTNVQQVCGICELFVYDICEKCLGLFPTNLEDQVVCSTPGCGGLRYKGGLNQQGKKLHKNSFVTVNIFKQFKCLLE
ncbi:hypothetical protein OS493_001855, partial [Desmophyllum pertusum]